MRISDWSSDVCSSDLFEYDGEMQANVALDYALMRELYPVSRLTGPANVLVMPGLHSANITAKLMQQAAGGTVIGPLLIGLDKPAQVVPLGATVNDLVTADRKSTRLNSSH